MLISKLIFVLAFAFVLTAGSTSRPNVNTRRSLLSIDDNRVGKKKSSKARLSSTPAKKTKPSAHHLPPRASVPGQAPGLKVHCSVLCRPKEGLGSQVFQLIRLRHQWPQLKRPPRGQLESLQAPQKNVQESQGSHAPTHLLKVSQADTVERSSKTVTGHSLGEQRGGHWNSLF